MRTFRIRHRRRIIAGTQTHKATNFELGLVTARWLFMAATIEAIYEDYRNFCAHLGIQPMQELLWLDYSMHLVPEHNGDDKRAKEQQAIKRMGW